MYIIRNFSKLLGKPRLDVIILGSGIDWLDLESFKMLLEFPKPSPAMLLLSLVLLLLLLHLPLLLRQYIMVCRRRIIDV